MSCARLARYSLWQLRDFFHERALAIVTVLVLFLWVASQGQEIIAPKEHGQRLALNAALLAVVLKQCWLLVGIIAINGISAHDRTTGRFRFLFAKPLSVPGYYSQAFWVNGVGVLLCVGLPVAIWMARGVFDATLLGRALLVLACAYLLVGGIGFFFSAVWRWDWVATGGVALLATLLRARFADAPWLVVLPPLHRIGEQLSLVAARKPLEPAALAAIGIYGLLFFALGLLVLRRRPLAT